MTTSTNDPTYGLYVGVDIAAISAKVSWLVPGEASDSRYHHGADTSGVLSSRSFGSSPQATLLSSILVVMEATGSYWISLATTLTHAGFAVSVINPAQAHHFAKALLKRAKTDAIDAQTLAQLAYLLHPTPWTPPPPVYAELQQRLAQRDSLLELRQQVRNQLHALSQMPSIIATVRTRMEQLIETLTQQLVAVDAEIEAALEFDSSWAASAQRLQTITGIGPLVAAWLLVTTLNFTLCESAEALTAYAGLAPHPYQSGTSVHGRACIGHTGNGRLRTILYLSTLSAAQHNPCDQSLLRAFARCGQAHEGRSLRRRTQIVASGLCRRHAQRGFRSSLSDSATATSSDNTVTGSTPHRPLQERWIRFSRAKQPFFCLQSGVVLCDHASAVLSRLTQ